MKMLAEFQQKANFDDRNLIGHAYCSVPVQSWKG